LSHVRTSGLFSVTESGSAGKAESRSRSGVLGARGAYFPSSLADGGEGVERSEAEDSAPVVGAREREARIERTRQRVRELGEHPEIVALREIDEIGDQFLDENEDLVQDLEAGEFRREAIIRRYGQAFADSLKRPDR